MSDIPPPSGDLLTAGIVDALRRTKPWVRLLSILGFLFVALMAVLGIGIAVFSLAQQGGDFMGGAGPVFGVLYVVLAIVYVFPALYLFRYASAIGEAIEAPVKAPAIENALRHQKSFWKFVGICTAIVIVVYLIALIVTLAISGFSTLPWNTGR